MVKKGLKALAILVVLWVVGSLGYIVWIGAWGILFPSHAHETTPPPIPIEVQSPAILLFTKTNSFRHREGIKAGVRVVEIMAESIEWAVFHTENGAVFNAEDLARFDVVMSLNTSGDILSDTQQVAFQNWLRAGGGWVGVHSAGDGSHKDWPWYVENLIGADFTAHILGPQFQTAEVINERPQHPVMRFSPDQWPHEEEWYSWEESPRGKGFTILARVDEDSYSPVQKAFGREVDLRMGDHPVVWARCVGRGRAVYSAMGHGAAAFASAVYQQLLGAAMVWAMDETACTGRARLEMQGY
jgi:type 1 glutamine amidotransferase